MSQTSFLPYSKYQLRQPAWSKDAVIYQVNTRQFGSHGTFAEVEAGLSHIKSLGADIIWLMPVQPIGEKNRKGTLGSPYAVKDYYGINAEFGTPDDFRSLVTAIHRLGMRVIIDWVPNHSAWDCNLVESHPHWYARDFKGEFRPSPWWDWEDIIEFDYNQPALRHYMIAAMQYWLKEYDIDGFRCDVAGYVPNDFWEQARLALDSIKPVFMLAEWENRDLHEQAFNMTYAWSWHETMHGIAKGVLPVDKLRKYYSWNERSWPDSAYRMTFVSNHDMNAWEGTQHEMFGKLLDAAIVLSVIGEGMPLIYNSQEAGETKRLAFFERDPIYWQAHPTGELYRRLIAIKKQYCALHNGPYGATMLQVPNNAMNQVFSFVRQQNGNKILVMLNLSQQPVAVSFDSPLYAGHYHNLLNETDCYLHDHEPIELAVGEYRLLKNQTGYHQ
ncbi:alpha-amylase family glycosyl hydrolase [Alteromonas lipotrueiana]|uniref:alpha-amylase family glycosyl hydrolase n=1 Tax=Alteromonas lipotrueiana TaxID=2803815 RepID=UPI001C4625AB|nr:alpha-amylase family glycosyl hydrolase [Alteromonas lipotrueiana]